MDLDDFRVDVEATARFLRALAVVAPRRVDKSLVDYLEQLANNPCGLEVLYNSLKWESHQATPE